MGKPLLAIDIDGVVSVFGFELACGTVRAEETDRIVIDTGDGVLEVDRDASADLGARRRTTVRVEDAAPHEVLRPLRLEHQLETVALLPGSHLHRAARRREETVPPGPDALHADGQAVQHERAVRVGAHPVADDGALRRGESHAPGRRRRRRRPPTR